MTNENKKTSYQLIFVHIFRNKYFKDNLENFMSESLNATSTPLRGWSSHFKAKMGFSMTNCSKSTNRRTKHYLSLIYLNKNLAS